MELKSVKSKKSQCETCITTKMSKTPFSTSEHTTTKPLQLVYSDIAGPFKTMTPKKHRFVIRFIDAHSKAITVYIMATKDQALEKTMKFCQEVGTPETLRTDNGGEYIFKEYEKFYLQNKIKREFTVPHTPEQME